MTQSTFNKSNVILDYLITNMKIMWVKVTEYKINFYSTIFEGLIWFPLAFLSLFIIGNVLVDIIDWSLIDYLIFFMLTDSIGVAGRFFAEKDLSYTLLTGKMNFYLTKPLHPFFSYYFSGYNPGIFVGIFLSLFVNIVIYILFWDLYHFSLLFFVIVFLLFLMEILFIMFVSSFNFFAKRLNVRGTIDSIKYGMLMRLPYEFMKNFRFSNVLFLFPYYFVGSLLIPLIKDGYVNNLMFQIYLILFLSFCFFVGIIINWHYGLKRYEAFG